MATRPACARVCDKVPGVQGVEAHGNELVIATADGSATISPVAVALAVRGPGARPHAAHADARRRVPRADRRPHRATTTDGGLRGGDRRHRIAITTPTPSASFSRRPPASSTTSSAIAGTGAAGGPPRRRSGHPAGVHRAVLLRGEHRHARGRLTETNIPGLRLQGLPDGRPPILLGVTGVSRARRWCSTCRTGTSTGCC